MRTTRALLIALLALIVVGASLQTPMAASAATGAPTGLKILSTSSSAISLGWTPVAGATAYRLEYSTSSAMTGLKTRTVTDATADLTGLAAGTAHYLRVTVVDAAGKALGAASGTLKASTRAAGSYSHLAPLDLTVTASGSSTLTLRWASRGTGVRYRIAYATTAAFSDPVYVRETATTRTLTGLRAGTTYYLRVRVISTDGANLSAYSPAITAATTGAAATAVPTGLKATSKARTALALSWNEVAGAPRYRIQYATTSTMAGAKYARFYGGSAELTGLKSGTAYWLRIRVITAGGSNLSAYSTAVKVTTATATSATQLPPTGLEVAAGDDADLKASWTSRGSGLRYEVQRSTSASMTKPTATISTKTSLSLTGLSAGTRYHVRVRVVNSKGAALSGFSAVASAVARDGSPVNLTVASFNIKCANCYSGLPNEGTWLERRSAVVAQVRAQKPDVIGFQEASQGWIKDASGTTLNKSQFEDLVERLGSPYKLTNTHRNNCVKSTTPTNCEYRDQGASLGTKIVYNSSRLSLVSQGSSKLPKLAGDGDRYVAWAVLKEKTSGKQFLFADTHLEHTGDSGGSTAYHDLRIAQTKAALAVINEHRGTLPVYFVGDFNSNKWTAPSNGPYDALRAAGFIDPLGNEYRTTTTAPGAIVEKRIRTNYSSYSGYNLKAPSFQYLNGTYIDYIWVSPGIEVPEWETVVDVDDNGNFVGRIPSDHNMIRASTVLP